MKRRLDKSLRVLVTDEAWWWLEAITGWIPGRSGRLLRSLAYKPFVASEGLLDVAELTHLRSPELLKVGKRVSIGRGSQLTCGGGLEIGDDVMVSQQVIIITNGHNFADRSVPISKQGMFEKRVVIDDDVWIGAGARIMPGVHVGRGAIVAAGAVVTKDVAPYTIVGGSPARTLAMRPDSSRQGGAADAE